MSDIRPVNFAAFDLNLLRVFDALMREHSVTRAGERVGLSQPAISAALGRLRHSLGDQLFVRLGNEMVPTPRAEAIAPVVREALASLESTFADEGRFDPATAELTCTLRGADFFSMRLMPDLFDTVATEAPGVRLRFLDSGHGDLTQLLQENAIDVALDRPLQLPTWVSSTLLFPSPFVVIAARGHREICQHRALEGTPLPVELFCALPHALRSTDGSMTGAVDDALAKAGHSRRVVVALPHFQAVGMAVAKGRLIAVVPRQFAESAADELGLSVYQPPIEIAVPEIRMYWHSRHDDSPPHRWLREKILIAVSAIWGDPDG